MLVAAALFGAGIVFGVYTEINNRIEYQQQRNQYLTGEIARLKKAAEELEELKKTKTRLVDRLNVIQKLQASRPGLVRTLDGLVRLIPQDIYLTSFKTTSAQITLSGAAKSDLVISEFMRSIRDSKLFGEPVLQVLETKTINTVSYTHLDVYKRQTVHYPFPILVNLKKAIQPLNLVMLELMEV